MSSCSEVRNAQSQPPCWLWKVARGLRYSPGRFWPGSGIPSWAATLVSDPCPHLAKGRCVRGNNCNHSHDHLSTEAIRAITCQVVRRPKGACKAGVNCVYYHPDAEPEPAEMICGNAAEE